ncbi:RNA 2',3'-cyclic phosphodiesterase [Hydrogenimonas urashimensis]|uniref:RNA 2',3'-cyclic phosphodiesterase n=1 Tax=Hydrogenimonas urashimensis TaxID=2740515 RepID=UPI001915A249|nr:RNA 2',3'-cyclic phosphodiesterase [Hydrogenimonas urashimensis]
MRLFLGSYANIEFYEEIRRDMHPFFEGKWVEKKNLHFTWFFLGEQPSAAPIIDRLQPLKRLPRLPLSIQGFGTFGRPHPKVFYLKTSSVTTGILHRKIAELLQEEPDEKFKAHITLARIKKFHSNGYEHLERPWMSEPLGLVEAPIYLIESRLTPSGPIYIPIEEF